MQEMTMNKENDNYVDNLNDYLKKGNNLNDNHLKKKANNNLTNLEVVFENIQ